MTRETKIGLVAACSLLCAIGGTLAMRMRHSGDADTTTEGQSTAVASKDSTPAAVTPSAAPGIEVAPAVSLPPPAEPTGVVAAPPAAPVMTQPDNAALNPSANQGSGMVIPPAANTAPPNSESAWRWPTAP